MRDTSNYPPGHPTGVNRGTPAGHIWECTECSTMFEERQLLEEDLLASHFLCPTCRKQLVVMECDKCGEAATHIDCDRAVNYHQAYCSKHGM